MHNQHNRKEDIWDLGSVCDSFRVDLFLLLSVIRSVLHVEGYTAQEYSTNIEITRVSTDFTLLHPVLAL